MPEQNAYPTVLEWVRQIQGVEERWFAEKYFPDWEATLSCLQDLEERTPIESDFGSGQRRKVDPAGAKTFTVTEVAERNGVSEAWLRRNVIDVLARDPKQRQAPQPNALRRAGAAFAVDLMLRHPLLPSQLVAWEVHEFVPKEVFSLDYLRQTVISRWHPELATTEREVKSSQLTAMTAADLPKAVIDEFIDGCYS